jgi:hypothetical protein
MTGELMDRSLGGLVRRGETIARAVGHGGLMSNNSIDVSESARKRARRQATRAPGYRSPRGAGPQSADAKLFHVPIGVVD